MNQWLRFEKPGICQVYARSSRVLPGDKDARVEKAPTAVDLVSDPVTVKIEPISPEKERAILHEAIPQIVPSRFPDPKEASFQALERLRYLQTPAAETALLQYVDSPYGYETMLGLYESTDWPGLAAKILATVREGQLGLSNNLVRLYTSLKAGTDLAFSSVPGGRTAIDEARDELMAAARWQTVGGSGEAYFADLFKLFRANPKDEVRMWCACLNRRKANGRAHCRMKCCAIGFAPILLPASPQWLAP